MRQLGRWRALSAGVLAVLLGGTATTSAVAFALVHNTESQALEHSSSDGIGYARTLLSQLATPATLVAATVGGAHGDPATFAAAAAQAERGGASAGLHLIWVGGETPAPAAEVDRTAVARALATHQPAYDTLPTGGGYRRMVVAVPVPGMPGAAVQANYAPFGAVRATHTAFSDLAMTLYAGATESPAQRVVVYGEQASKAVARQRFELGGATFTAVFSPSAALVGRLTRWLPWIVMIGGALISLLIAGCVEALARGRRHALELVAERTAELERLANFDELTGLPNRRLLMDRLGRALAADAWRTAVLFVDVDHFKGVNDAHGHAGGDALLVAVAERLSEGVRGGDTVARLGGDEFVVICSDIDGPDEAHELADRLAVRLQQLVVLPTGTVRPSVSIGVTLPCAGDTVALCLSAADSALYVAKQTGRGRHSLAVPKARRAEMIKN